MRCWLYQKRVDERGTPWRWQKAFMSLLSAVVFLHLRERSGV